METTLYNYNVINSNPYNGFDDDTVKEVLIKPLEEIIKEISCNNCYENKHAQMIEIISEFLEVVGVDLESLYENTIEEYSE